MMTQTTRTTTGSSLAAYQERIAGQIKEAEIVAMNAVKAARQNLEEKLQGLTTMQDAHIARAKVDIDAAAAALKTSLDDFGRKLSARSDKK